MYEELNSKTSYIHSYMFRFAAQVSAKKPISTQNLLQMENVDINWNLEGIKKFQFW